jgi:hypothetical protein
MATRKRVGLREVRNLQPNQIVWDVAVPGFGARRQRGDAVSYVLFYRNREGRQRWFTIGRHGGAPWTPDTAREEAKRLLGEVAHKADPAAEKRSRRNAKTVAELCDLYLADAKAGRLLTRRVQKKPSTLAIDAGRIERHIKPLLGRRTVSEVTRDDVEAYAGCCRRQDRCKGEIWQQTRLSARSWWQGRSQSGGWIAGGDLHLCSPRTVTK